MKNNQKQLETIVVRNPYGVAEQLRNKYQKTLNLHKLCSGS
jgi:hypothetical protein